ncbi:GGDEF domain-containing protein [Fundidesulfovibrio soli]|uniref:GGDEF domain-containing protein n=1 Tax=Fundidesulfovibrio soli TaxID=2922716 RepID=UPI001FAF5483|nr:GGDEF domain-containing protein [Fundidesulfovibrio soli]
MKLDIMTLLVMNLIIVAVSVWATAILWVEHRRRYRGTGFWLASMVCQSAGLSLVLLKGLVPDYASIVLANLLIQSGSVGLLAGFAAFVGESAGQWRNVALLALFTGAMAVFTYLRPDMQARQITVSVVIILIMSQACWLLFRKAPPRFRAITNLAGYVLSGYIAASALRIAMTLANPLHTNDFFISGVADALAITLYTTLNACLSICLTLVVNRRLLADVQALKDEMEVMATHDALTGLPNRSLFRDRFAVALENAKRGGTMLAVMSIDLDGFKQVNDTLGHAAGDELLVQAAGRITGVLRRVDTVARFGGDEFVLLLWELETAQAAGLVAEKVLASLRSPFLLDGTAASVTASIGIALFPQNGDDAEGLVKKSDQALYLAKADGKDGFRFSS